MPEIRGNRCRAECPVRQDDPDAVSFKSQQVDPGCGVVNKPKATRNMEPSNLRNTIWEPEDDLLAGMCEN